MDRHLAFNQPTDFLRRRDFGQKMNATFDFIRAHATPLVRVLVIIVLPLALLTGIGAGLIQGELLSFFQELASKSVGGTSNSLPPVLPEVFTLPTFWLTILSAMLMFAVLHLTVFGYVVLQAERTTKEPVTAGEVWQLVKDRFLGMVGSFIGLGLLFVVGVTVIAGSFFALVSILDLTWLAVPLIFALYLGFIYAIVALNLYFIVWLRERRGFFGSLTRCFRLIWGKWWSTLGLIMVIGIITTVVLGLILTLLSTLAIPFGGLTSDEATEPTAMIRVITIVVAILESAVRLVLYPLLLIAISFQYFNLVERHDGTGTRLLVDSIGEAAPVIAPQALRPDDDGEY